MIKLIRKIFKRNTTDFKSLVKQGAVIVDVRTKAEYDGVHARSAVNIPVDNLEVNFHHLPDKNRPIITCCASGVRSAKAARILLNHGYRQVFDGGSWIKVQQRIS